MYKLNMGKKTLLFGVHQFIWHPVMVLIAWYKLYGMPNWKEVVCIIIHDWGYWFTSDIDGPEGESHPEVGAKLAGKLFGKDYYNLCLYHSRSYAKKHKAEPSRLCWADKLSVTCEPWWFYLFRASITGEIKEYRSKSAKEGFVPLHISNQEWFCCLKLMLKVLSNYGLKGEKI